MGVLSTLSVHLLCAYGGQKRAPDSWDWSYWLQQATLMGARKQTQVLQLLSSRLSDSLLFYFSYSNMIFFPK